MAGRPPTGTVTFLFTDVEGSTKLLADLGQTAYAAELQRHRSVVRDALTAYGGYEVDTQGDAFFCAFSSARDAVACAAAVLRGLEATRIRVRMGIHTGEAMTAGSGYVGMDVHRGARVAASGHGGQIVLSPTTATLLDPIEFDVRDLGEHRLKDLGAPIRLYQLGEGAFPPLKTLYRTNLPVPATAFVGREREVETLVQRASQTSGVLTLTGPGGTGKTRLALQVAAELAEQFPDGIFWAPLAPVRDPGLVPSAVAEAAGVKEEQGVLPAVTLGRACAGKRMLLLLDNCEHVLAGVAEVVPALVSAGVHVVATSRERLALSGEEIVAVDPLRREDSIALFRERARAAGAHVDGEPEATAAIDALCARLDDLPLALELAAARSALLPPRALLERLSDRLDLLQGPRDAEERQRTLHATIDWSYGLLEPSEQEVLRRFAVFVGGGSLEAVEFVCLADVQDVLSLVDKSLVRQRTEGSRVVFWLLETVREFALSLLEEAGDADDARDRHLEWFLELARSTADGKVADLSGADLREYVAHVEPDAGNMRVAFGRALERASETARDAEAEAVVALATALRPYLAIRGRFAEAEDVLAAALPYARDPITAARLRVWLAEAKPSHSPDSAPLHDEAERLLESAPDRDSERWWATWIDAKLSQAHRHYWTNDHESLVRVMDELRPALEAHAVAAQRAEYTAVVLQEMYRRRIYVFTEETDALADEAYAAAREIGDWYAEFQRGFYMLWRGDPARALTHFAAGREVAHEIGDAVMEVRCLVYASVAERKRGRVQDVADYLETIATLPDRYGYEGLVAANHTWVAWRNGELGAVDTHAAAAFADWLRSGRSGPTVFQWTARFPLLAAELARGNEASAFEQARCLVDPAQQPLPRDLHELIAEALETGEATFLERAVDAGRDRGYT